MYHGDLTVHFKNGWFFHPILSDIRPWSPPQLEAVGVSVARVIFDTSRRVRGPALG